MSPEEEPGHPNSQEGLPLASSLLLIAAELRWPEPRRHYFTTLDFLMTGSQLPVFWLISGCFQRRDLRLYPQGPQCVPAGSQSLLHSIQGTKVGQAELGESTVQEPVP